MLVLLYAVHILITTLFQPIYLYYYLTGGFIQVKRNMLYTDMALTEKKSLTCIRHHMHMWVILPFWCAKTFVSFSSADMFIPQRGIRVGED